MGQPHEPVVGIGQMRLLRLGEQDLRRADGARVDPGAAAAARTAELRYFAGLTVPEVAQVIGVSTTMIEREWGKARAWLALRLRRKQGEDD